MTRLLLYLFGCVILNSCGGGSGDAANNLTPAGVCDQFKTIEEYYKSDLVCRVIEIGTKHLD